MNKRKFIQVLNTFFAISSLPRIGFSSVRKIATSTEQEKFEIEVYELISAKPCNSGPCTSVITLESGKEVTYNFSVIAGIGTLMTAPEYPQYFHEARPSWVGLEHPIYISLLTRLAISRKMKLPTTRPSQSKYANQLVRQNFANA